MMKRSSSVTVLVLAIVLISGYATFVEKTSAASNPESLAATPTPISRPRVSPTPTPSSTPKPTFSPSPTPTPQIQTLADLQSKLRGRLFASEVRRGRVGVKIVSLNSGKVIFENDADKYYMPASNMKNFTVAAALERLGPDFKFVTSVFAASLPDPSGTVRGDLRIYGRGDVSISTAFFGTSVDDPETYYKGIDRLVDRIAAAGVKRIEGSIVGDESYFKGFAIPEGWEWDDLQAYYGAEISALPLNDNAVDLAVRPGSNGTPCLITISPPNSVFQLINTCITGARGGLRVVKKIDRNVLEVSGSMAPGEAVYRTSIAVTRPAELFVQVLKQRLERRGIVVTGTARALPTLTNSSPASPPPIEIARLESPPFSIVAAKTMKPSQNMFTETILWTLGEEIGRKNGGSGNSSNLGSAAVKAFLKQIGVPDDGIVQYDGSGLSRHNLITPSAVVTLYTYMAKQSPYSQAWHDSLTIGGVDGTLANRFKGTAAAANMRGKTGTIDQVSALSGYVTTAGGEQLVVSFVVNGVPGTSRTRTEVIDDMVVYLANFNGKIE